MPSVKPSASTVTLPQRTAQVIPETDVLVVGGGPAGLGAALGAAEAGAKVVLAEQYGFLGGNATSGLVLTIASYHTSSKVGAQTGSDELTLFPINNGEGKPIIGGVLTKLVDRLVESGGALPPSVKTGFMVPFDPELFKIEALELLDTAGVDFLFHAFASSVITDKDLKGVVFETKSGPLIVKAKVIVDCTGDGDVAAFAGAPFQVGRDKTNLVQPMGLLFLMEGFVKDKFKAYVQAHPDQWLGIQGLTALMQEAEAKGELNIPRENILLFGTAHEGHVFVNSTRILNTFGTSVWDLTRAEIEGRRQIAQLTSFFRKYVPGFEKAYVEQSGVASVRESRRIMCEYKLTAKDVLEAHRFSDVIALGSYPIDLHNASGKGTILKELPIGKAYDIPLRCLIPLKVENLLVGGRCISGTHVANASYRTMPICMATGQAAGVCAAIAIKNNLTPRMVNAKDVQNELILQGAILKV